MNLVLSQKRTALTADEETGEETADASSAGGDHSELPEDDPAAAAVETSAGPSGGTTSAAGVAVTNYVGGGDWTERPERNLLVVIHPWCMLRKSGADRQSEFPPPGFLERLKAKLLSLQRETDEQRQRRHVMMPATAAAAATVWRRRSNNQKIKCWIQYTAAVAAATAIGGAARAKAIASSAARQNEPLSASADFLTVRRRFAAVAAAFENADG